MPYNILLLPLLGGFLFINYWDRTRWHAHRAEKERLLIFAALAGLVCLAAALVVRSFVPVFPCFNVCRLGVCARPCFGTWWERHIGSQHSGIATFALLLGAVGWLPLNLIADWYYRDWGGSKRRELVRVVHNYGGPLEQLLLRSMQEKKLVMLTLKGGKVYIGDIGTGFIPGHHTAIHLLPAKSGFRDDQQRLTITTDYEKATIQIAKTEPNWTDVIGSFVIVIPVDEVVAASLYLPEIHTKYFAHEPKPYPEFMRVPAGQPIVPQPGQPAAPQPPIRH